MKGVIASAVIAAVIVAGSVAYTNHIDKVSRELGEINDRVMAFLYDGDYESAGDEIEKLVQYLDENRTVLAATGNHKRRIAVATLLLLSLVVFSYFRALICTMYQSP